MLVILVSAQTVAIGALNPRVITPSWLVKYNICSGDLDLDIRRPLIGDGAVFELGPFQWRVDGQRLRVSSSVIQSDCGTAVSRVLQLLPHTPVQAIGQNFYFRASKEEWGSRPTPQLGGKRLKDLAQVEQMRLTSVVRNADARLEVSIADENDLIMVSFNYHRNLNLEKATAATKPEKQIEEACQAAERFPDDFKNAKSLLGSLFAMEISDE